MNTIKDVTLTVNANEKTITIRVGTETVTLTQGEWSKLISQPNVR